MLANSFLYEGVLVHERIKPRRNFFKYSLFMAYFDLDELYQLKSRFWWGINQAKLVAFHERDYLDRKKGNLKKRLANFLEEKHKIKLDGPVRMLTHLRYFGFCFNPVTFYYCFSQNGRELKLIVADINNTPWNEKYAYVLPVKKPQQNSKNHFFNDIKKVFHVSPFFPMDQDYEWEFSQPQKQTLTVLMKNFERNQKVFSAHLFLKRNEFSYKNLLLTSLKYPWMTLKVFFAIYWQALVLLVKKTSFFSHPESKNG